LRVLHFYVFLKPRRVFSVSIPRPLGLFLWADCYLEG
jgi:hypothetical protein